jgi:type I restriction enzyme, S subunit
LANVIENPKKPSASRTVALHEIARHHSGNGKLIKGKLHAEPSDGLYPAFSASGQDVWHTEYGHEGDAIIVSAVGARCGKCFMAQGRWSAIANTHVVWPDPEQIELKYLWYLLNDEQFWIRSGSAQPFVSTKKTFEKEIALPPLDEQRAIVAEVEKQFTRLEAGVGALKRVQASLKRYRAAVLKAACEGKLVPTEAELAKAESRSYETGEQLLQRILAEGRKNWTGRGKYKEPAAPDATNLPELSEGWVWATFDHVVERMKNGTTTDQNKDGIGIPVSRIETIWDSKIDWMRVRHISSPSTELLQEYTLKVGDLLFSHINSDTHLGKTALYTDSMDPLLHGMNLMLLRPDKSVISPSYLHFLCMHFRANGTFIRIAQHAVNQSSINQTKLKMVSVPLPPLPEQNRIVEEVERRLSVIEELEATVSLNLQRATRLRQSILQKAFK